MDEYNLIYWSGETVIVQVEWDSDITAEATLVVSKDGVETLTKKAAFVDNFVDLSIAPGELETGLYNWHIMIEYPNGDIDILPEAQGDCEDGNCLLPTLEICGADDVA